MIVQIVSRFCLGVLVALLHSSLQVLFVATALCWWLVALLPGSVARMWGDRSISINPVVYVRGGNRFATGLVLRIVGPGARGKSPRGGRRGSVPSAYSDLVGARRRRPGRRQ